LRKKTGPRFPIFSRSNDCTLEDKVTDTGILQHAQPAIIICSRDRVRATAFYRDVLGLTLESEDKFAAVFRTGGVTLRLSLVADFVPHGHTILGFRVADVRATVQALRQKGAAFQRFPHLTQDESAIWTAPPGTPTVAWFKDPDGNLLSVFDA
jgi:catechol 2,3-dioxygenase-like lactoylglutathione lyase family enzyme